MITARLMIRAKDVVFLKGIVEASEGLAQVFAEKGGDLLLAAPLDRASEFESLVHDLVRDLGAVRVEDERG